MTPYLSLAIWVPILAGAAVLVLGGDRDAMKARWTALAGALAGFLVTIPLYTHFDATTSAMQFVEIRDWIPYFYIRYHLGVDGISVLFVLLNSFVTLLVVWAGWEVIQVRVAQYMAAFLIMSGLINGAFAALDGILFYVFFEAMLIPMYLIIGIWGGPNRVYAAIKFFLYTLLGSLLMLVAFIYLYQKSQSFSIEAWYHQPLSLETQILIFVAFFAAFAVKVPMWPVHTWLPDAHPEAPTGGSVVLAAITLKIGAYGFIRFILPILPDASRYLAPFIFTLSLIAIVYIGFVALVQADMKRLIAYSSISHMGFVTLGFFLFSVQGAEGALAQAISHGFVSAAMFLCVGVLYDRMHTHLIADFGGVANTMPRFAAFVMLFSMANAGLPATSGFVGEFLVILAAVKVNFWIGFLAAISLILGAAYTLWMYKRVIYGDVANAHVAALKDLSRREFWLLGTLAAAVLIMGVWPRPFIDVMHVSVADLLAHVANTKIPPMMPDFMPVMPEIVVLTGACIILLIDVWLGDDRRHVGYWLTQFTLLTAACVTVGTMDSRIVHAFHNMVVDDLVADVLRFFSFVAVSLVLFYSRTYLTLRGLFRGETFVLMLFALLGMQLLITSGSFLTLYLGLELMSLSLYALVAMQRDEEAPSEAAMKYFVLGALASGFLLYGMSMIYGATGSLEIDVVTQAVLGNTENRVLLLFGLVFVVSAIAFKLGAVPYHMWVPDVYQGAPTAMTLLIGTAPEFAAFAMMLRLLAGALIGAEVDWQGMLVVLSVLSVSLGHIVAIAQTNIKRMLAYSTIANMGYVLMGFIGGDGPGYSSAMFYMLSYVLTSLASWGVVLLLSRKGFESDQLDDLKGLNARSPWWAFVMLLVMFSLAGLPPTVGFYAKLLVLESAIRAGYLWLAVIGVMAALIGAFYYLRIVKLMYFDEPTDRSRIEARADTRLLLSANGLALLYFGILPQPLMGLCAVALKNAQFF